MKLIPLSQSKKCKNKELNLCAKVDDKHFEELNKYIWRVQKAIGTDMYYACRRNEKGELVPLHRFIMGCKKGDGKIVDHIDRNGLNCLEENLRFCTVSQNAMNKSSKRNSTSKYLGVHFAKMIQGKKIYTYWRADIKAKGRSRFIGFFKTEENAAIAYNIFAEKYHGEFANFNTSNI